jgi:hypothetical protein
VGVELVFVTARPPRWVDHLAGIGGVHATMICANGAFTYDVARRTVIRAHGMPPALAGAITADLRQALPGVGFAAELADGMRLEREYPALHPEDVPAGGGYCQIDAIDQPVGKLLARSWRGRERRSPWQTPTPMCTLPQPTRARRTTTTAWPASSNRSSTAWAGPADISRATKVHRLTGPGLRR